jgi:hypothetical protein
MPVEVCFFFFFFTHTRLVNKQYRRQIEQINKTRSNKAKKQTALVSHVLSKREIYESKSFIASYHSFISVED